MAVRRVMVPAVGLGMAVAGVDKLSGDIAYRRLYRRWGWSERAMYRAALAEVIGGSLMAWGRTRRLGGVIMATASVPQLVAEMRDGEPALATARTGVLLTALAALLG